MKKIGLLAVGAVGIFAGYFYLNNQTTEIPQNAPVVSTPQNEEGKSLEPHDQWLTIRSYPNGFDQDKYMEQMEEIKAHALAASQDREVNLDLDWLQEGPGNIGGRVNTLTANPSDNSVIYAGAANGGVFKTTDGGETWSPIFDDLAYLSIGAISVDPSNESTVYVGTGDRNFGGGSYIGNGIYKSENGGTTWTESGLTETGVVTEILIDPNNTDRIFASTLGSPFEKNSDRGIYRSENGGDSWENILFITDSSGIIDMVMDPLHPDTLYASGYNRMRSYVASSVTGPQAIIYKTINGGETWSPLTTGLPDTEESRIGLTISNENPEILYALYVDADNLDVKDVYKTINGGETWEPLNVHDGPGALPGNAMGGFGWYFGEIYMNPFNNDQLLIPGVNMYQSLDAGETWSINVPEWWTYEVHADKHAITFIDEDSYIIGTDGGIYKTENNGDTWEDIENLPITQLYHIDVDPNQNGRYGAGAQDNGSMSGNATNFNSWERLYGGDGFRITFLEDDPGAAYYETQNGGIVYFGSFAENLSPNESGADRTNWDTPYYINEKTEELFAGTAHIQLMTNAPYGTYEYISNDLTRVGLGDYEGTANYHTITEIDQPKTNYNLLFVGTSDGLVWKGERTGDTWNWINITGDLPNRYVTGVRCSPNTEGTVYVSLSGYKNQDGISYLYKSTDFGENWVDITSNLPAITVNDILAAPGYENDEYLFAALDGGVYVSDNAGDSWGYMGVGMPTVTVSELHFDIPNKKLIAGTYSRSVWSYDVSWLEDLAEVENDNDVSLAELNTSEIKLYPNPVIDYVHFENVTANEFSIYDQSGKLISTEKVHHLNGYSQVNLSKLKTGIYFFSIGKSSGTLIKN